MLYVCILVCVNLRVVKNRKMSRRMLKTLAQISGWWYLSSLTFFSILSVCSHFSWWAGLDFKIWKTAIKPSSFWKQKDGAFWAAPQLLTLLLAQILPDCSLGCICSKSKDSLSPQPATPRDTGHFMMLPRQPLEPSWGETPITIVWHVSMLWLYPCCDEKHYAISKTQNDLTTQKWMDNVRFCQLYSV